jgi:hypothetical protein
MRAKKPAIVKNDLPDGVNSEDIDQALTLPKPFNFAEFKRKNTYLSVVELNGMRVYMKGPTDAILKKIKALKGEQAVINGLAQYMTENVFTDSEGTIQAATFEEWSSFGSIELSLIFSKMQRGIMEDFTKNLSRAIED